jgi:DNA repair protein RadA/Sms
MAKKNTVFFCKECGFESTKWVGQCPGCKTWNSFTEEPVVKKVTKVATGQSNFSEPKNLSSVITSEDDRTQIGISEFDRVLGGGIVTGSLVLVGGDPGIGKSTLLLQMCKLLTEQHKKVLYISGEESLRQIKMRAERLGDFGGELLLLSETNLDHIQTLIDKDRPEIIIVDSIQTMYKEDVAASPGSVSQVRESTATLMHMAKGLGITIFIIGHVTKEGVVAGPRVLEHMVDTVLYFEGDNSAAYRILRAVKNRFGSTNEIGVFEMKSTGLCEVTNPSEYMLQGKPEDEPGSVIAASLEGTRTMLVEVQALVCQTYYNMPRRTAAGTDYNRVNLLLAVLEKRLGIQMSSCDVYVNVAGGMKINEPALDLAIVMAILSSHRNRSLSSKTIVFGEVGLTGEVRAVNMAEQRVMDAKKMGYEICVLPQVNKERMKIDGIQLIGIKSVRELNHILHE